MSNTNALPTIDDELGKLEDSLEALASDVCSLRGRLFLESINQPSAAGVPSGLTEARIVRKATCISVHRGNEVLANFAGPDSEDHAALFVRALASAPAPVPSGLTPGQIAELWDSEPIRRIHGGEPCRHAHVEFARALLASAPAPVVEPVAIYHGGCTIDCGEHGHHNLELLKMIPAGTKLYDRALPTPPAGGDDARDAGRYRWLRSQNRSSIGIRQEAMDLSRWLIGEAADSAIDAAIAAQVSKEKGE